MSAQDIRRWQVGDAVITRIVETAPINSPVEMMFPGRSKALLEPHDWLKPHFISSEGEMLVAWQCFVVKTPSHCIMVDTCIGNDRQRHFDIFTGMQNPFLQDMEAAGFPPDSIDTVLCTHLHYDHVGWNTRLVEGRWVPTFPRARYLFNATEWEHIQRLHEAGDWHAEHLPDALQPVVDAGLADFIGAGHRIGEEVSLIPTPGHTPGHVSVLIESRGEKAVITGDVMHHPLQFAMPHEACNFDHDKALACLTRAGFLSRFQDSSTLIVGSHFPEPTAGYAVRNAAYWRFDVQGPAREPTRDRTTEDSP